jgi:hypothetical protein
MDLQIIAAHSVVIRVDEKILADEEEDRDGDDADEIFLNTSAFNDQMPRDREEQDFNDRVQILSDKHLDELDTDDEIEKIDEIVTQSQNMDLIELCRQIRNIYDRSDDNKDRHSDFQDQGEAVDPLFDEMDEMKHAVSFLRPADQTIAKHCGS